MTDRLTTIAQSIAADATLRTGATWIVSDRDVAAKMNDRTTGQNMVRSRVDPSEVFAVMTGSDFLALTQAQRDYLRLAFGVKYLDFTASAVQQAFNNMFAANTTTGAAIRALATRKGSIGEQLLGEGASITDVDIELAKKLVDSGGV